MQDEPSTNELLDDRSLQDCLMEPEPESESEIDGMPLEDLLEPPQPKLSESHPAQSEPMQEGETKQL